MNVARDEVGAAAGKPRDRILAGEDVITKVVVVGVIAEIARKRAEDGTRNQEVT